MSSAEEPQQEKEQPSQVLSSNISIRETSLEYLPLTFMSSSPYRSISPTLKMSLWATTQTTKVSPRNNFPLLISNFFSFLDDFEWTYKLEEGICTESLAFHTAKQFDIDDSILSRASDLLKIYDKTFSNNSTVFSDNTSSNFQKNEPTLTLEEEEEEDEIETVSAQRSDNIVKRQREEIRLAELTNLLNDLSSSSNIPIDSSILVPNNYNPPPVLQGKSVVYVLYITSNDSQVSFSLYTLNFTL